MTRRGFTLLCLAIVSLAGCGGAGRPGQQPSPPVDERTANATADHGDPDGPPQAIIAVEGGDPVDGQVGSYVWRETGSDAPWLPGAPLAAGAGESLRVGLVPPAAIGAWRARYVPAGRHDATGAIALGDGVGPPMFPVPPIGLWTVEVQVDLRTSRGSASYYWQVDVK